MHSHPCDRYRGRTIIDLVATLFIVTFLGAILIPLIGAAKQDDIKVKCASNLKQIGQALLLYSNENRGMYPRTIYDPAHADKPKAFGPSDSTDPFGDDPVEANDVTAAIYLLMRTQDIGSKAFVCPATKDTPFDFGGKHSGKTVVSFSNFPERKFLSYSYANPYPSKEAVKKKYKLSNSLNPAFAVAADMNPGTAELLQLTLPSPAADMTRGNTRNHGGEGQNVLFADGHIEFATYPFVGIEQDNIYTYGPSGKGQDKGGDGITGSPVNADDSVLLPTAE